MSVVHEDVEKLEPSHVTRENVKWYSPSQRLGSILQGGLTLWLRNSPPRYTPMSV